MRKIFYYLYFFQTNQRCSKSKIEYVNGLVPAVVLKKIIHNFTFPISVWAGTEIISPSVNDGIVKLVQMCLKQSLTLSEKNGSSSLTRQTSTSFTESISSSHIDAMSEKSEEILNELDLPFSKGSNINFDRKFSMIDFNFEQHETSGDLEDDAEYVTQF